MKKDNLKLDTIEKTLLEKINSDNLENKPLIVIDLNSGGYIKTQVGHEIYNLEQNPVDGRYYGYCPPWDNVDIKQLGAQKNDNEVSDVVVVYVSKNQNPPNREVIAFTDQATVHKDRIIDPRLKRIVLDNDKHVECTYTIESDYLYDLRKAEDVFEIDVKSINSYMFRKQRFYGGKYPELEKKLRAYLSRQMHSREIDDDLSLQTEIQKTAEADVSDIEQSYNIPPKYNSSDGIKKVTRNIRLSRAALKRAQYLCEIDSSHKTFMTDRLVPYMEGHHLIPCTASNSEYFWKEGQRNIDCVENIVCLCPTCHRQIHFGSETVRNEALKLLFDKRKEQLARIGLRLTLNELISLYDSQK